MNLLMQVLRVFQLVDNSGGNAPELHAAIAGIEICDVAEILD